PSRFRLRLAERFATARRFGAHPLMPGLRRFILRRHEDPSQFSGTGDVCWGVLFPDGVAVTRWCVTDIRQTCVWASLEDLVAIHGHDGATEVVWLDEAPSESRARARTPPPSARRTPAPSARSRSPSPWCRSTRCRPRTSRR